LKIPTARSMIKAPKLDWGCGVRLAVEPKEQRGREY
jgi:hypothetical protein